LAIKFAPCAVNAVAPPEIIETFPVVALPNWSVCLLVVPRMPLAVRDAPPVIPADREAVGIPPATLTNANLALPVAVAPSNRS